MGASWPVPADTASDVFLARFTYATNVTWVLFVVRPADQPANPILFQLSWNTYQAYNPWLGQCYYDPPVSDGQVFTVSYRRPCQLWDYILYEQQTVRWLQDQGYPVDFCTNFDLHFDAGLLPGYQLFISCGHDEYWSEAMRDRVEAFGCAGGNLMILSGNTCYRPVVFSADGATMHRRAGAWSDLGRPEGSTIGVNWSAGYWSAPLPARGYTVQRPDHWVFDGLGFNQGDSFGTTSGVIGYETDAATYFSARGDLVPNGTGGTPDGFTFLATADLPDWLNRPGKETMGIFRRERGLVLNAATTQWGAGLGGGDAQTDAITANMIDTLRHPAPPPEGSIYAIDNSGDVLFFRRRQPRRHWHRDRRPAYRARRLEQPLPRVSGWGRQHLRHRYQRQPALLPRPEP